MGVKEKEKERNTCMFSIIAIIDIKILLENVFNQIKYVYLEERASYIGRNFKELGQLENILLEQEVM